MKRKRSVSHRHEEKDEGKGFKYGENERPKSSMATGHGENSQRVCQVVVSVVLTACDPTCTLHKSNQKFLIGDEFGRTAMLHAYTTKVP